MSDGHGWAGLKAVETLLLDRVSRLDLPLQELSFRLKCPYWNGCNYERMTERSIISPVCTFPIYHLGTCTQDIVRYLRVLLDI